VKDGQHGAAFDASTASRTTFSLAPDRSILADRPELLGAMQVQVLISTADP